MADKIDNDSELDLEDTETDGEAYVEYDIASYPSDFTLSGINDSWNNDDIIIPDFQREFVWNIKQSSWLIESFLLGLPVPPVFFYVNSDNKSIVIDGQQRILSIVFYFDGYFGKESLQGRKQVFRLSGLSEKSPYFKKTFKELDETSQRKLRNAVLRAVNIKQLLPKENTSVYHIFERLNTGGTPLKPQEIRNCVFRGHIVSELRKLNNDANWRKILGKKNNDKHQRDVELILRLFALYDNISNYEKPMKEFLNNNMKAHKSANSPKFIKFTINFPKASKLIVDVLGEKPFNIRGPLNTAVLDSVFTIVLETGSKISPTLKSTFHRLIKDNGFLQLTSLGTTDTSTVKERFRIAKEYLAS